MAQVIWSPRALLDLDRACEYVARDSPYYAYVFAERALALVERIAERPLPGGGGARG